MIVYENEQIDDLQLNGLSIIQKRDGFKYGTDAVLLSEFAKDIHSDNTLDLCTGTGIIPILMSAKTKTAEFYGIEIQEDIAQMAARSVSLNGLEERIHITCGDLKDSVEIFGKRRFDLITCNPPYMRTGSAILNKNDSKIISRHEVLCTLEDIISVSSMLLSLNGRFAVVYKPSRLCDLTFLMRKYEIEPKRIRFVHKNTSEPPVLVLAEGLYKGKSDVSVLPPLILEER